jgi:hypothetical protein
MTSSAHRPLRLSAIDRAPAVDLARRHADAVEFSRTNSHFPHARWLRAACGSHRRVTRKGMVTIGSATYVTPWSGRLAGPFVEGPP